MQEKYKPNKRDEEPTISVKKVSLEPKNVEEFGGKSEPQERLKERVVVVEEVVHREHTTTNTVHGLSPEVRPSRPINKEANVPTLGRIDLGQAIVDLWPTLEDENCIIVIETPSRGGKVDNQHLKESRGKLSKGVTTSNLTATNFQLLMGVQAPMMTIANPSPLLSKRAQVTRMPTSGSTPPSLLGVQATRMQSTTQTPRIQSKAQAPRMHIAVGPTLAIGAQTPRMQVAATQTPPSLKGALRMSAASPTPPS